MMIRKRSVRGVTSVNSQLFGKATVQRLSPLVTLAIVCFFLPFSQGLKERFEAYRRAYNQHDSKAVLSFLAESPFTARNRLSRSAGIRRQRERNLGAAGFVVRCGGVCGDRRIA